jgi:hypothetical protein
VRFIYRNLKTGSTETMRHPARSRAGRLSFICLWSWCRAWNGFCALKEAKHVVVALGIDTVADEDGKFFHETCYTKQITEACIIIPPLPQSIKFKLHHHAQASFIGIQAQKGVF